jgi:hypothetical protein
VLRRQWLGLVLGALVAWGAILHEDSL